MPKNDNNNNNVNNQAPYKEPMIGFYFDRFALKDKAILNKIEKIEEPTEEGGDNFEIESRRLGWGIDDQPLQQIDNIKKITRIELKNKLGINDDAQFDLFSTHVHQRLSNIIYEQLAFYLANKDLLPQLDPDDRFFHIQTIKKGEKYLITACPGRRLGRARYGLP